ncbi:hypothetical protein O6H91_20G005100 [Diphasiastrum complanatum]|uniref:Uncharacterized protein n=1 Tax=Diphasiastrum complanatum TaxID=34168 RepID=A0ACC2AP49_DIPCM|nr:hypothetical protein O6H91_20G005100 [Diphasiastrum complanatum]
MFKKNFLPENETNRNWEDWETCCMGNHPLTQHIASYRDVTMKLSDLDDYNQVRGFIRGLQAEYQKYIRPLKPKTLETAITLAQTYDDIVRPKGKRVVEDTRPESSKHGEKRKIPTSNFSHKKRYRLSRSDIERAKREHLCFICLGKGHNKSQCPKVQHKGNTDETPGKNQNGPFRKPEKKQVHTVQVLPLGQSPKVKSVHVSHINEAHTCSITANIWQPTVGPHTIF